MYSIDKTYFESTYLFSAKYDEITRRVGHHSHPNKTDLGIQNAVDSTL